MYALKRFSSLVMIASIVALAYWLALFGKPYFKSEPAAIAPPSPWDSLSAADYQIAANGLNEQFGEDITFIRISLQQPDKGEALNWREGTQATRKAELTYLKDNRPFQASVNLATGEVLSSRSMSGGHPMLSNNGELEPIVMGLANDPQVLAVLAQRGIAEGEAICLPRTVGRFFAEKADIKRDRILRLDCFYIKGSGGLGILPSTNVFARPIEGIGILYNISTRRIIEIVDSYEGQPAPPHDISADEFHDGAMGQRAALKPIDISRPQGHNFTITNSKINWQGWQFRLRFDARQGTVLNRVGHNGPDGFRSVAYEIAMSEMFVPYYDNDPNWYYRAYFDMGEYGFGNLSTPLRGTDCPSGAVYQSVMLHLPDGTPFKADNRICIFEHDPGHPSWRHYEALYEGIPGMAVHQSRRATELVVRMVATIGNYDYFQDYVFGLDGRLRIRLISTGVDAVKGVVSETLADATARADTATGTLIAPHRVAVNHDHFFSYRMDMDVDGTDNNFDRMKLQAIEQADDAPRRGIWGVVPQRVTTEQQAQTRMSALRPALLVFSSSDKKNTMGYPSAYQLMMPNVRPLVSQFDETYMRAYFVQNNLWVTRFKPDEIFASGLPVNQSAPYLGLPEYIADNENIEAKDLVAWTTIGFHHVPMAEDWPVMPSKVDEIVLKPRNFFDRNPAIDLRAD
jgi:primary-amine oxidase